MVKLAIWSDGARKISFIRSKSGVAGSSFSDSVMEPTTVLSMLPSARSETMRLRLSCGAKTASMIS